MTDEEWSERIAKEKKARAEAVGLLCQALQAAGVPLLSLEIFERGASDCMVKATFTWGVHRDGQTSLWTPRTQRSGISCARSRSSGGRKEEATCG